MAKSIITLLNGVIATGAGTPFQFPSMQGSVPTAKCSLQGYGTTSTGSGAATIAIEVTLDGSNWITAGTINLTLGTSSTTDGFSIDAPWGAIRANVTALSGTDATVYVKLGL